MPGRYARRLFSSVAAAWKGCNEGTSDVKELVPEFFYEPEFLRNADGHALGTRQVGPLEGDIKMARCGLKISCTPAVGDA